MSNNGIPPLNDWQADNYPVIYDEGDETLKYVKTGSKHDIETGGTSYLVYSAILAQTGTDAPVATVLQNTLGGTVVWSYAGIGYYQATLNGVFTSGKTHIVVSGEVGGFVVGAGPDGLPNTIALYFQDSAGSGSDGWFYVAIEIRVYP